MKFAVMRQLARPAAMRKRWRWHRGGRCIWCNRNVSYRGNKPKPTQATRDHLIPRSKGGGGGENIVLACRQCNSARGTAMNWIPWREVPVSLRRQPAVYGWVDGEVRLIRDWRKQ